MDRYGHVDRSILTASPKKRLTAWGPHVPFLRVSSRSAPHPVSLCAVAVVCLLLVACSEVGSRDATTGPAAAAGTIDDSPVVLLASADGPPRLPALRSAPPLARVVTDAASSPFAQGGGVVLLHVSAQVELIGFHEAMHDGARQLEVLETAVEPMTLDTRNRGTGSRSAADIVVDPEVEIRSPVTGVVLRAGSYVLYCDYSDSFVVIAPDAQPDWEVQVLHVDGLRVRPGDRVTAGMTILADRPTQLPFTSQVDRHTAEPSWPHVHVEVIDPSIPRRPGSGSSC
jgi:hypothetical protein